MLLSSTELLSRLLAAAIQFSGLPAIGVDALPPVEVLDRDAFYAQVCPSRPARCTAIMAAFDTQRYRILIRDSLDLERPAENSFLVHELVHVLQYKKDGSTRFMSCEAVLESERGAFDAQNLYMAANGVMQKAGFGLRYMHCPPKPEAERDDGGH